jgi:hypothetical protein
MFEEGARGNANAAADVFRAQFSIEIYLFRGIYTKLWVVPPIVQLGKLDVRGM